MTRADPPHRTYYAIIDPAKGTIARYVHHWGCYGVRHLRTVQVEPPEVFTELGTELARKMLEEFRATGSVT